MGESFAIRDVQLFEDGQVIPGAMIVVEGGTIRFAGPQRDAPTLRGVRMVEGRGLTVAPGFIELQTNGGYGHDFTTRPASVLEVAKRLPETGVVAFLPTFITSPLEEYAAMLRETAAAKAVQGEDPGCGARVLGAHIEGPFLSPVRKGAHRQDLFTDPTPPALAQLQPLEVVRLLTLAPEREAALEAIRWLSDQGVVVSIGHSNASEAQALAGMQAGARYATHLYNAMNGMQHRDPGLVGTLLTAEDSVCGLIADGIHVHPRMIRLAYQSLGPRRITLVTDAMEAMGMPPGEYGIGGQTVIVDPTSARLRDGTLAGSILRMDEAVRNMVNFSGCSPAEAVRMASATPAEVLGIAGETGHLRPGCRADLVILDAELQVVETYIAGQPQSGNH